jgi:alanine racemase
LTSSGAGCYELIVFCPGSVAEIKGIELTARPTVAEIDLRALGFNYRQIRERLPEDVCILAVVKADAYGHGAVAISRELARLGAAYLGVATADEGIELREAGVRAPILILGGVYGEEADQIVAFDLATTVFHEDSLRRLSLAANARGKCAKVHLKVDTGMARLGSTADLWPALLKKSKSLPGIEVEGILSHFSMAEEEGFTDRQWREFQQAADYARDMEIRCKYLHVSSSAALITSPSYSANLVRPGILLYGSVPSSACHDLIHLKPVMTLKTEIHFMKSVPPGTRISYGGTFVTQRDSLIATLPIGYADGYSRQNSHKGEVLIREKRAPIVGSVCMDFLMVDVTDVPGASMGDEAVLMGRQGKEEISSEEIARNINSIPYEVFCAVGKRVPRIYIT